MKSKIVFIVRFFLVLSLLGCGACLLWAGNRYVHTDTRFNVRQITFVGLKQLEEDDVLGPIPLVANGSTNIFAVDLNDVRSRVGEIQWVRYASVERILPDQILIHVVEREPIGLARIQGRIYEFDAEAAILEPNTASTERFPILNGLVANDVPANLARIAMYRKVIEELGESSISEIRVDASNDVSVIREEDALIVNLGVEDFKKRWSHYLELKAQIDADFKDAVVVDFRFRNKVVVSMHEDDDDGKVIWDGKKKSL